MKILLDTNVLISAFITDGFCTRLLHYAAKHHDVISSLELLLELDEKLRNKFDLTELEIASVRRTLDPILRLVQPIALENQTSRDVDDDVVLASAIAGECDYIVTGDKDLLVLQNIDAIRILTPRAFWNEIMGGT